MASVPITPATPPTTSLPTNGMGGTFLLSLSLSCVCSAVAAAADVNDDFCMPREALRKKDPLHILAAWVGNSRHNGGGVKHPQPAGDLTGKQVSPRQQTRRNPASVSKNIHGHVTPHAGELCVATAVSGVSCFQWEVIELR
jgi:hypothetical protein